MPNVAALKRSRTLAVHHLGLLVKRMVEISRGFGRGRGRYSFLILAALGLTAPVLGAQVRGAVRDSTNQLVVAGAVVSLLDSAGSIIARS